MGKGTVLSWMEQENAKNRTATDKVGDKRRHVCLYRKNAANSLYLSCGKAASRHCVGNILGERRNWRTKHVKNVRRLEG
jgi:hypothetical protein